MENKYLGEYYKLKLLGKGSFATVYKVRHAELGYVRAVKELKDPVDSKENKLYQSFLRECRTLLSLGNGCHPNIIRIYQPRLIDSRAVVEMDYVDGITFDTYLREQRKGYLTLKEVYRLIHEFVGAMAYCHYDIYQFLMDPEKDELELDPNDGSKYLLNKEKIAQLVKKYAITHNDLHTNNIMRRKYDGMYVLLDFGLAIQDGNCIKSSSRADGAPEYESPEKIDSGELTPASDVYSIGIILYEALTGSVPFPMELDKYPNPVAAAFHVQQGHKSKTPESIGPRREAAYNASGATEEFEACPEWLEKIVMKCLEKDPHKRFANARELINEVEKHLNDVSPDSSRGAAETAIVTAVEDPDNEAEVVVVEPSNEMQKYREQAEMLKVELDAVLLEKSKIKKELSERIDTIVKLNNDLHNAQMQVKTLTQQLAEKPNAPGTQSDGTKTGVSPIWRWFSLFFIIFSICFVAMVIGTRKLAYNGVTLPDKFEMPDDQERNAEPEIDEPSVEEAVPAEEEVVEAGAESADVSPMVEDDFSANSEEAVCDSVAED